MAGENAAGDEKGGAAGKKGMIATIAAVAILTVLATGGGLGLGWLIKAPTAAEAGAVKAQEAADAAKAAPGAEKGKAAGGHEGAADGDAKTIADETAQGPVKIVPLAPVITNIYSPSSTWLRVEASLVVRDSKDEKSGDNDALLAQQVQADTLAYLRSIQLAQLDGSRGLLHLRDDLRERAMMRSPDVVDYLISSLVAE